MQLLMRIQQHLRQTGMSPTAFGRRVMNDPRFVADLRNGREPRTGTRRHILAWIDEQEGGAS